MVKERLRARAPYLIRASYGKDADKLKQDYTEDKQFSGSKTKVFIDNQTGKPVIIHRGTQTLEDVGTDIMLALGLGRHSRRLQRAKRLTKKVEEKYGQAADTLGHSLGGYLAENSGAHGDIITYNKAESPNSLFNRTNSNQLDIHTVGDVISLPSLLFQRGKKEVIKNSLGGNSLTEYALKAHDTTNLVNHDKEIGYDPYHHLA